jgi:hypothetical protein
MPNSYPKDENGVPVPPKTWGPKPQPKTQAEAVFAKFGGVPNLCKALREYKPDKKWSRSGLYKWNHPKEKQGRGGMIPSWALRDVLACARREGIVITSEDLYPGEKR